MGNAEYNCPVLREIDLIHKWQILYVNSASLKVGDMTFSIGWITTLKP
jgi:hypothetical protein